MVISLICFLGADLLYIFTLDTRTEEQDPAFESESPPEDGKESPPKVGKLQSAANALAQMIANGTGSISKLKPR